MRNTMGIILTSNDHIPPITDKRAVSALPMAGRFRLIDFVLSNMANAGIINIGVATESNYSSLMDHLKSGKPWDLDRKNEGLTVLPPDMSHLYLGGARGDIDVLSGIYKFIKKSKQTYVILSIGTYLYHIDFQEVISQHITSQSDVTIVYKDMNHLPERELSRFTLLSADKDNRVTDIEVTPHYPKSTLASMGLFVMEKALLESIIDECSAKGEHDFVKDALIKKLGGLCVNGYEHNGYMDRIDTLKSYYRNNMLFLNPSIQSELFQEDNPIYTKVKDQPPSQYCLNAIVDNCFISDGCSIEGTVENCVLSRGVQIKKGAIVRNSIIMQDSIIDEDVVLDHVVFDKEVCVTRGKKLIGQENYPLAIAKGTNI